jgi:hypothetical protein
MMGVIFVYRCDSIVTCNLYFVLLAKSISRIREDQLNQTIQTIEHTIIDLMKPSLSRKHPYGMNVFVTH